MQSFKIKLEIHNYSEKEWLIKFYFFYNNLYKQNWVLFCMANDKISIDKIICDKHPDSKFKQIGIIPNSDIFKGVTKINEVIPSKDLGGRQTDEYFCKQCNIKLGEFHKRIF